MSAVAGQVKAVSQGAASAAPQGKSAKVATTGEADARRQERVLSAARRLFLKKGIRKTPVEDIARAAGIAKGSVYLSFPSKDAVFAALAVVMTESFLQQARKGLTSETDMSRALTAYLVEAVGIAGRDLFFSRHAAELINHRAVRAAGTMAAYETALLEDVEAVLRVAALPVAGARQMVAAAYGLCHMADLTAPGGVEAYRRDLTEMVGTLLVGFEAQSRGASPKISSKVD